jgi:hypothetical protein
LTVPPMPPPARLTFRKLPMVLVGPRDIALRMTGKKYLFREYVAYQGRRQ